VRLRLKNWKPPWWEGGSQKEDWNRDTICV